MSKMKDQLHNTCISKCLEYILEHEHDDYVDWCDANGEDPADLIANSDKHIYANALLATGGTWSN